ALKPEAAYASAMRLEQRSVAYEAGPKADSFVAQAGQRLNQDVNPFARVMPRDADHEGCVGILQARDLVGDWSRRREGLEARLRAVGDEVHAQVVTVALGDEAAHGFVVRPDPVGPAISPSLPPLDDRGHPQRLSPIGCALQPRLVTGASHERVLLHAVGGVRADRSTRGASGCPQARRAVNRPAAPHADPMG